MVFLVVARILTIDGARGALYRPSRDGFEKPGSWLASGVVSQQLGSELLIVDEIDRLYVVPPPIPETDTTPGRSLAAAWVECLTDEGRNNVFRIPRGFQKELLEQAIAHLFDRAKLGHLVLAGKELPTRPGAPYVKFNPADAGTWHFGMITDTATPRVLGSVPSYAGIRVFTPEEWLGESELRSLVPATQPQQPAPRGRKKMDGHVEFLREAFRRANSPNGFVSRSEMREQMLGWVHEQWENAPADRTIERWLEELYPDDLPHR
jgi:hypothetical protein